VHELYEPKTPLQEQRDYERERRLLAEDGIELPAWDDLPEADRYSVPGMYETPLERPADDDR
jgi:hypothetical protein